MHKKIISVKPNSFYETLKKLYDSGFVVGPVITNNFDGLIRQAGIPEKYVRKYSDSIFPDIVFHKEAKSLIVVGTHADRRHIQQSARRNKLKVIYIDPEGYYRKDGSFACCPLESIKKGDILIREPASVAFCKLKKILKL